MSHGTAYYWFWLDEVPRGELSEDDEEVFSAIQEKLDWTSVRSTCLGDNSDSVPFHPFSARPCVYLS